MKGYRKQVHCVLIEESIQQDNICIIYIKYIYVCLYICIHIYIYMYTLTHTHNLLKAIYERPTMNIIFHDERVKAFPEFRNTARMSAFATSI